MHFRFKKKNLEIKRKLGGIAIDIELPLCVIVFYKRLAFWYAFEDGLELL